MKKVKKMADGGISGLGQMLGMPDLGKAPSSGGGGPIGGGGGGGSAMDGLGTVNQGAASIGSALGRASEAIGGGGGFNDVVPNSSINSTAYKKGGKVTTTRMSTAKRSTKSPNW